MRFTDESIKVRVIGAEQELTHHNAARFRARVELAACSAKVIVDLTNTRVGSWAMLMLLDLQERLGWRISFVAPEGLRKALREITPPVELSMYASVDEAVSAASH